MEGTNQVPSSGCDVRDSTELTKLQMMKECEELWKKIQQVHGDVYDVYKPVSIQTPQEALIKIQKAKQKRLQAEIDTYKDRELHSSLHSPPVMHVALKDDLTTSIKQLEETLIMITSQKDEISKELNRVETYKKQFHQINDALTAKISALENQEMDTTEVGYLKELERKEEKAVDYKNKLMRQLRDFIKEHFPAPSHEELEKWRKKHPRHSSSSGKDLEFVPLQIILEDLMNRCIDTPHDPYIMIEPRHWPPYIELLLRCGIALKHPDDDQKMKLVPFHL